MREIFVACLSGNLALVKDAFESGKINKNRINELHPDFQISLLCFALHSGNLQLVKYLSDLGASLKSSLTCSRIQHAKFWIDSGLNEDDAASLKVWLKTNRNLFMDVRKEKSRQQDQDSEAREIARANIVLADVYKAIHGRGNPGYFYAEASLALEKLKTIQLNDVRNRADCLFFLAQDAMQSDNRELAKEGFTDAYTMMTRLIGQHHPLSDPIEQDKDCRVVAKICYHLALTLTAEKNFDIALEWHQLAIVYVEKMSAPDDDDLTRLMKSCALAGYLCETHRHDADTNSQYQQKVLALNEKLKNKNQFEVMFNSRYRLGHYNKGKFESILEKMKEEAEDEVAENSNEEAAWEAELAAYTHFLAASVEFSQMPEVARASYLTKFLICQQFLGNYHLKRDNYKDALRTFQVYVTRASGMTAIDEDHFRRLSVFHHAIAVCQIQQGNFLDAIKSNQTALRHLDRLPFGVDVLKARGKLDSCLAACRLADKGITAVIEDFFLAEKRYSGGDIDEFCSGYASVIKFLGEKDRQTKEAFPCLDLRYLFYSFVRSCLSQHVTAFQFSFDQLQRHLMYNAKQTARNEIVKDLNHLLSLLFTAADENNRLLKPEVVAYLKDSENRSKLQNWEAVPSADCSSENDSESLTGSDSESDDLFLPPMLSVFSAHKPDTLQKAGEPATTLVRRSSSGFC